MDSQSDDRRMSTCRNCDLERMEEQIKEMWFLVTSPHTSGSLIDELSHKVPQVIFALTHDSSPDVRYSIAENYSSPIEALDLLTEDENPYVAYRASMTLLRIKPTKSAQQLEFPQGLDDRRKNQAG